MTALLWKLFLVLENNVYVLIRKPNWNLLNLQWVNEADLSLATQTPRGKRDAYIFYVPLPTCVILFESKAVNPTWRWDCM